MASSGNPTHGALVAIGGAEDKSADMNILERVLSLAPPSNRRIGVITTASSVPEEVFAGYHDAFSRLGASEVRHVAIADRAEAADPDKVAAVRESGVIFLSGGDQLRLTHVLGGSRVLGAIREHRANGGAVAGTSAGAAAMSLTMIYNGNAADALRKGAVKMSAGLGFVEGIVIDSHFLERGRFTRLMEVGATNPEFLGVGIGEDAAVQFHHGVLLEALGTGHVIVVDSSQVLSSDVTSLNDGEPVAVEYIVMHALTNGCGYHIGQRKFLRPEALTAAKEGAIRENTGASRAQGA